MKTEIQGNFKDYALRFKMPSKKCFLMPLKSAGIILLFETIFSGTLFIMGLNTLSIVLSLMVCMLAIGYYIKVLYKRFWNVVLEESKGLIPDAIMWLYYMLICAVSLSPALVLFYLAEL